MYLFQEKKESINGFNRHDVQQESIQEKLQKQTNKNRQETEREKETKQEIMLTKFVLFLVYMLELNNQKGITETQIEQEKKERKTLMTIQI